MQLFEIVKSGNFKKRDTRKEALAKEVRKYNWFFDKTCKSHNDKLRKITVWRNVNATLGLDKS